MHKKFFQDVIDDVNKKTLDLERSKKEELERKREEIRDKIEQRKKIIEMEPEHLKEMIEMRDRERHKCHTLQQSQSEVILKQQAILQRTDQMAGDFKFYNK